MTPKTEKMLVTTFHIASDLAFGLKIVITIPALIKPIAAKTKVTVPVIIFAVEAENKKWI